MDAAESDENPQYDVAASMICEPRNSMPDDMVVVELVPVADPAEEQQPVQRMLENSFGPEESQISQPLTSKKRMVHEMTKLSDLLKRSVSPSPNASKA